MSIKLRWLGSACFEIGLPSGKVIITDPYIRLSPSCNVKIDDVTGADYIVVTHGAMPAVIDVGPLVKRFGGKVICAGQVGFAIDKIFDVDLFRKGHLIDVTAGNTLLFDDVRIEVKKARHPALVPGFRILYQLVNGKPADPDWTYQEIVKHLPQMAKRPPAEEAEVEEFENKLKAVGLNPPRHEQLNFVFQGSDNIRVYLFGSGPFEFLKDEVRQAHCHVFLPELGGNDPIGMAEFSALSGASVIIPSHHDMRGHEMQLRLAGVMAKRFRELSGANFIEDLDHGKWYEIGVGVAAHGEE